MGRCAAADPGGMVQRVTLPAAESLHAACARLRGWLETPPQIHVAADAPVPTETRPLWVRVELQLDARVDVLASGMAVGPLAGPERVYFHGRDKAAFQVCGWGFAAKMDGRANDDQAFISQMVNATQSSTLRFYGGMRFDQDYRHEQLSPPPPQAAEPWHAFGNYTFVLPVLELQHHPSRRKNPILALNLRIGSPHAAQIAQRIVNQVGIASQAAAVPPAAPTSPDESRKRAPHDPEPAIATRLLDSYPRYADIMQDIMRDLGNGDYQKLVLVRRRAFDFAHQPDPLAIAAALSHKIGGGYLFCLQLDAEIAFLGCSPERLFRLQGASFATEAMAGTVRRNAGCDPQQAERTLRNSAKDLLEHKYVVDYITDVLRSLGASVQSAAPEIVELPHLLHLHTEITGEFHGDKFQCPIERTFSLLRHLHPTPAVCGMPRQVTIARIPSLECFDRGFYAGPFGYFGQEATEFCVAIRSALVGRKTVTAYAGGGIVKASLTKSEWDEGELKMSTMTSLLSPQTWTPSTDVAVPADRKSCLSSHPNQTSVRQVCSSPTL